MTEATALTDEAIRAFAPDAKIGLVATVGPAGLPHVSLITSLSAKDSRRLMFGQFSEGLSKRHVRTNPRVGFLVMTPSRDLWRGKARWTGATTSGEDYAAFNDRPMFRYNSYFGIHTVHYLDVVVAGAKEKLTGTPLIAGSILTNLVHVFAHAGGGERILTPWAEAHLSHLSTLKFLSYVGSDGYPVVVPAVPGRAAGSRRLLFAPILYRRELAALQPGTTLAVFALNLRMESVLLRGVFAGYRRAGGMRVGVVDVDWVYNSMPPKQGQIFPRPEERVSIFSETGLRQAQPERLGWLSNGCQTDRRDSR